MKELDDFTVERLQAFIDKPLDNGFGRAEQMALARIALAAKTDQENCVRLEVNVGGNTWIQCSTEAFNRHKDAGDMVRRLYEAPILNSLELPDDWIHCTERMPDDSHPRARVLAYTPNQDDAMTYRALPAGLFRTVARDATHWKYIEPPTTEK